MVNADWDLHLDHRASKCGWIQSEKAVIIPVSVLCLGQGHICFASQVDEANTTAATYTCSLGSQHLEPMAERHQQ